MKNKIIALITSLFLIFSITSLKAEMNYGISLMAGQANTSGHELENGAATDKNSADVEEFFVGGSIFVEIEGANGVALGLDYVPLEVEIGDGTRTDTAAVAENGSGTRKASASLEDLVTVYASFPLNVGTDLYGKIGYHMVEVTTSETLPNASYGNDDITGYQLAVGKDYGNFKGEIFYSDFEDVSLTASGGSGSHKIEADADALGVKISFSF